MRIPEPFPTLIEGDDRSELGARIFVVKWPFFAVTNNKRKRRSSSIIRYKKALCWNPSRKGGLSKDVANLLN